MARSPLLPCVLCDQVPGQPRITEGKWNIMCPLCGRSAESMTEDGVRSEWERMNAKDPKPLSPALELLDSIEIAMCDLEAIRQVPGAMDVWHRWSDDLAELRRIVREYEEGKRC